MKVTTKPELYALPRFCTVKLGEEVFDGVAHCWTEYKSPEGSLHLVRVENTVTGEIHDVPISAVVLSELNRDDLRQEQTY